MWFISTMTNIYRCTDDLFGNDIMQDIWEGICSAGLIIADLTTRNPNVFYELGLAHTLGKDFLLITQDLADLPFDLRRFRCVEYEDNSDGYERLRTELSKRLVDGPGSAPSPPHSTAD